LASSFVTTNSPRYHRVNEPGPMLAAFLGVRNPATWAAAPGVAPITCNGFQGCQGARMPGELDDTGAADHGGGDHPSA